MSRSAERTRRWSGGFCLSTALCMLIAGETVLRDQLTGLVFLLFWLLCFVFACLAILLAFMDVSAIRRRTRDEHRQLFADTLRDIDQQSKSKPQKRRDNRGS